MGLKILMAENIPNGHEINIAIRMQPFPQKATKIPEVKWLYQN